MKLQENEYETYDSWFPQFKPSYKGSFFRQGKSISYHKNKKNFDPTVYEKNWGTPDDVNDLILRMAIMSDPERLIHTR